MPKRQFSAEFKKEAVRLASTPGVSATKIAEELGIHPNSLRHWITHFDAPKWEATAPSALQSSQRRELDRVNHELTQASIERDILNKASAYFAKTPK
ncbi:MAG TPA: transposase [Casimicrobiaceae bacterium]|nr:transposase [Casimicrobiaceae bacterium]